MGKKIRVNRFGLPRRSKFPSYMDIVSTLPQYPLILKIIEDKRNQQNRQQHNMRINHGTIDSYEEERKQNSEEEKTHSLSKKYINQQQSTKIEKRQSQKSRSRRMVPVVDPQPRCPERRSNRKRKPANRQKQYQRLRFPSRRKVVLLPKRVRPKKYVLKRKDGLSSTIFNTIELYFQ